jgi:hypothetical protein
MPITIRASGILPSSVVTGYKGNDSEENHVHIRKLLHGFSIISPRYECVPYCNILYFQRNKDETIICHEKAIWRIYYIKVSKDTEQRTML